MTACARARRLTWHLDMSGQRLIHSWTLKAEEAYLGNSSAKNCGTAVGPSFEKGEAQEEQDVSELETCTRMSQILSATYERLSYTR